MESSLFERENLGHLYCFGRVYSPLKRFCDVERLNRIDSLDLDRLCQIGTFD
jgi:hypothetical protein